MAFNDDPIVDNNSKASEESVLEIRKLLSREHGFLSREELPDYGADLDIELISKDKSGATGKKFAVQIKSSSSLSFISNKEYVSFSFKTSRLGYLCRRTPGFGLIILIDWRKTFPEYILSMYKHEGIRDISIEHGSPVL